MAGSIVKLCTHSIYIFSLIFEIRPNDRSEFKISVNLRKYICILIYEDDHPIIRIYAELTYDMDFNRFGLLQIQPHTVS